MKDYDITDEEMERIFAQSNKMKIKELMKRANPYSIDMTIMDEYIYGNCSWCINAYLLNRFWNLFFSIILVISKKLL